MALYHRAMALQLTAVFRKIPDGYIGFLTEFDDPTMFDSLEPADRDRALTTLRERLGALDRDDLTMSAPIVYAIGRRSG